MSIRSIIMSFLMLFTIVFLGSGCKKGCKACDYGTTCNPSAGYCFCPNGLEGDSCHTLSAAKYLLTYIVSDNCSGSSSYTVYISFNDPNYPNRLAINGLFNLGQAVEADIYSNSSKQGIDLVIPDQNLGAAEVSGSGLFQLIGGRARITLNMDYVTGGYDKQCTVILTQQ